ncbi:pilus assembly protein N-terminal domain-containing protein [Phocaeicola sp.]|uniref:pilus assembly protein N-terminal domain-containing protein n=1 Tax=Phocaeicola sp. TaxID=2773926 RepID=UPI003867FAB6
MKIVHLYMGLMLFASCALYACSEDETPTYPEENDELVEVPGDKAEISVNTEKLEVIKEQTKTLEITEGAGDYRVSVLDSDIAEASLEGNVITVTGVAQGETEILISDKDGGYKNVKIDVYLTDNLVPEKSELNISLPFGKPSSVSLNIAEGNGGYTAVSSNESIIVVKIDEAYPNTVVVNAVAEGEAEITITDSHGLSAKVSVVVTISDSPYTDEELEGIKAQTDIKYVFSQPGSAEENFMDLIPKKSYACNSDLSVLYYGKDDVLQTGVYYSGNTKTALTIGFETKNDFVVGQETTGYLHVRRDFTYQFDPDTTTCTFKVIQKQDGKVWAIYYTEMDGNIYKGYMIFAAN